MPSLVTVLKHIWLLVFPEISLYAEDVAGIHILPEIISYQKIMIIDTVLLKKTLMAVVAIDQLHSFLILQAITLIKVSQKRLLLFSIAVVSRNC